MGWGSLKAVCLAALVLAAAACVRDLGKDELPAVAEEARMLMAAGPGATIETPAIDALHASVRVEPDGVYIKMLEVFVEEDGYFVPRDPRTFDPKAAGDPSFRLIGEGVYRYHVAG